MSYRPIKAMSILLALSALSTFAMPAVAAETYRLDSMHTAVTCAFHYLGFSSPSGKFMSVDGTLILDEQNPVASKVSVTIPVAAINSGIARLGEYLKSKDFFEVEKFPTTTYVSTKVGVTGEDTPIVHDILTLHGITKPMDLNIKLNQIGENVMKKETAGFRAFASFKRFDFGIMTYAPALGDDVRLYIKSEANL